MNSSIGQRLRTIREQKGFTQQQLELELDASFGHISKIESGKVNPTKETLLRIAEILWLDDKEKKYLLGLGFKMCTESDIQSAIALSEQYLEKSPYPAYLADDLFYVYSWNKKILDMLGVSSDFAASYRGVNNLELLFHQDFKKLMSQQDWEELLVNQLTFFIKEVNYDLTHGEPCIRDLVGKLGKYKEFKRYWEQAYSKIKKGIIPGENLIWFVIDSVRATFFMSVTRLSECPRFRITEYIPS
jgi:transcriptional regulator with XRE-family HTH domain